MRAPALMLLATALFSVMGVCVKWATQWYSASEVVMYRGLVGALTLALLTRAQGGSLYTSVPMMHLWRSAVGVLSLGLWFYAIGGLPLGTAITLNYTSSVWMTVFIIVGTWFGGRDERLDRQLLLTVFAGFVGVALVLQPTLGANQGVHGVAGLLSGFFAAFAYLQVASLSRMGEPENRIVFYFSIGGVLGGGLVVLTQGDFHAHTALGAGLLLAVGVLATAAQLCMTRAYAVGHAVSNGALAYLGVAFSFVLGVVLFDDPVSLSAIIGMLMITAAGIAATLWRSQKNSPPPHQPASP